MSKKSLQDLRREVSGFTDEIRRELKEHVSEIRENLDRQVTRLRGTNAEPGAAAATARQRLGGP